MKKKSVVIEDDICPKSPDWKHKPDWHSVVTSVDVETYIDINFKYCGSSGCIGSEKTLEENIQW